MRGVQSSLPSHHSASFCLGTLLFLKGKKSVGKKKKKNLLTVCVCISLADTPKGLFVKKKKRSHETEVEKMQKILRRQSGEELEEEENIPTSINSIKQTLNTLKLPIGRRQQHSHWTLNQVSSSASSSLMTLIGKEKTIRWLWHSEQIRFSLVH